MNTLPRQSRRVRGVLASVPVMAFLLAFTTTNLRAAPSIHLGFSPPSSLNESNSNAYLDWTGDPFQIYKVQSATNLSAQNPWTTEDAVTSSNSTVGPIRWMAPESLRRQKYYRLMLPQLVIFTVEPAVVEPGVTQPFDIIGQCFDSNTVVTVNGVVLSNVVLSSSTLLSVPSFTADVAGNYQFKVTSGGLQATYNILAVGASLHPEQVFQGPPDQPAASPETASLVGQLGKKGHDAYRSKTTPENRSYTAGKFMLDFLVPPGAGGDSDPHGGSPLGEAKANNKSVYVSRSNIGNNRMSGGGGSSPFIPSVEPAAQATVKRSKSNLNNNRVVSSGGSGGAVELDDSGPDFTPLMPALMKAKEKANQTKCMMVGVKPFSGEVQASAVDMYIPGRSLDFVWGRCYRSRVGTNTAMGQRWSHSYDVHADQSTGGITVCDGTGCRYLYLVGGNGVYSCNEQFNQGTLSNNAFTLTFPDTGRWVFNPFDGSATAGKLIQIITRNGDTMTLGYDTSGRLSTVVDDLNRTNTVAYNTAGYVSSVTDFTGRSVTYQYYQGLKADNGGAGDLMSVTSPPVTGTPNGNDFPAGKTTTYTYSKSFPIAADQENHLLLTVTDAKGQSAGVFFYEHSAASPNYLCCTSAQEGTNTPFTMSYLRHQIHLPQYPGTSVAECVVNDPVGNVTECSFDARNRLLRLRQDTGRAVPGVTVTATDNRPTGKLRSTDPDYFDTTCAWNDDSLCTSVTYPQGDGMQFVYQRDLDSSGGPRKNGDLRVCRQIACCDGGDTDGDGVPDATVLTSTYQYDPSFGSPAMTDRRTITVTILADNGTASTKKSSGSGPHFVNPNGLPFAVARKWFVDGEHLDNETEAGAARKWFVDGQHLDNETSDAACSSGSSLFTLSAVRLYGTRSFVRLLPTVNKITGSGAELASETAKFPIFRTPTVPLDFSSPPVVKIPHMIYEGLPDFAVSATDPRGNSTTATYDSKGNVASVSRGAGAGKVTFNPFSITRKINAHAGEECDFTYNTHGQLAAFTNSPDANGIRRVDTFTYYPSGTQAGYLQSCVVDSAHLALTEGFEFDPRGNLTRYIDPLTNDWLCTYNALDQPVQIGSATLSLCFCKIEYKYSYDANDKLTLVTVDNLDSSGTVASPPTWNTQFTYDQENRLVSVTEPISGTSSAVTTFAYDGNDQCVQISSPEAVAGHDPANTTHIVYDERKDMLEWIASYGTPLEMDTFVSYDPDGRPTTVSSTSDTCSQGVCQQTDLTLAYDGFGHCVSATDALGNVGTCAYDRNGNLIYARLDGETNDVPGGTHNVRLAECRYVYDEFDCCVLSGESFFDPATQAPLGGGVAVTSCTYAPNDCCVSVTDALGNTTSLGYDTACRLSSVTNAHGDFVIVVRDTYGNARSIAETDLSDTGVSSSLSMSCTYDSLNRLSQCTDSAGNTESFGYDSRGDCVRQTDALGNDTACTYDGLSRCVSTTCYQGSSSAAIALRTTQCAYDGNGRCVATTDANSHTTTYGYDSLDNLVSVSNPDGTTCSLVWSPRSNLVLARDANGSTISNTYDRCDKVIHRDLAARNVLATTTFETFVYDGMSQLTLASNDVSSAQFSYDSMGNSIRSTQDGLSVSVTCDLDGNPISQTCASGAVMTYSYDVINRLTNVAATVSGVAHPHLVACNYDGPGRLALITRDNGLVTRLAWDGLSSTPNATGDFGFLQVSAVSHQTPTGNIVIDRRSALYDRNQNRIQRSQTVPFNNGTGMTSNSFSYDALNQLRHAINTKGTGGNKVTDYGLDANGNRTAVTNNGTLQTYTMDGTQGGPLDFQMDQYTTTPFGAQTYDNNGNLLSVSSASSPVSYQYDCLDRLITVSGLSSGALQTLASFSYDALGRRISKTVYPPSPLAPVTTRFEYEVTPYKDGEACVAEELTGNAVNRTYARTPTSSRIRNPTCSSSACSDAIVAAFPAGGSPQYYHADDLGNTLALTDNNGSVLERTDYDDFGAPQFLNTDGAPLTDSTGQALTASSLGNPYLFHAMQWDGESALYLSTKSANPLYSAPETGRCITAARHALGQDGGWTLVGKLGGNAFEWLGNNPWSGTVKFGPKNTTQDQEKATPRH